MISKALLAAAVSAPNEYSQEDTVIEIEHVFYTTLKDMSVLDRAIHSEHQEQWEYKIKDGETITGTMRSRMIDMGESYEFTIKEYTDGSDGVSESNLSGDEDMHKVVSSIANHVVRKIRYIFPVSVTHLGEELDLKWEVDVYFDSNKNIEPIVKLDFEIPKEGVPIPKLPFEVDAIIDASFGKELSKEDRAIVDGMWKRVRSKT